MFFLYTSWSLPVLSELLAGKSGKKINVRAQNRNFLWSRRRWQMSSTLHDVATKRTQAAACTQKKVCLRPKNRSCRSKNSSSLHAFTPCNKKGGFTAKTEHEKLQKNCCINFVCAALTWAATKPSKKMFCVDLNKTTRYIVKQRENWKSIFKATVYVCERM